jgi:hexosaminidase
MTASGVSGSKLLGCATTEKDGQLVHRSFTVLNFFTAKILFYFLLQVKFDCWQSTPQIINWMTSQGMGQTDDDYLQLWDIFQQRAYNTMVEANGNREIPIVLWTSHLTQKGAVEKYLDNQKYIIQIWTNGSDEVIAELVNKGFRVIFSNHDALYFDCG